MTDKIFQNNGRAFVDPPLGEPLIDIEEGPPAPRTGAAGHILLGISLVLIAFNLRAVFSSLSTVLPEVVRDNGLTAVWASALTTLPVICLGLFSFPAPGLARRLGAERVILAAMVIVTLGTAVRGFGLSSTLFLGSFLAGAGIAVVNVLLPGLVKRDFPDRLATMTGFYTMALCGSAAGAAAFTVPLEKVLPGGWPAALRSGAYRHWRRPCSGRRKLFWRRRIPPPHGHLQEACSTISSPGK